LNKFLKEKIQIIMLLMDQESRHLLKSQHYSMQSQCSQKYLNKLKKLR